MRSSFICATFYDSCVNLQKRGLTQSISSIFGQSDAHGRAEKYDGTWQELVRGLTVPYASHTARESHSSVPQNRRKPNEYGASTTFADQCRHKGIVCNFTMAGSRAAWKLGGGQNMVPNRYEPCHVSDECPSPFQERQWVLRGTSGSTLWKVKPSYDA